MRTTRGPFSTIRLAALICCAGLLSAAGASRAQPEVSFRHVQEEAEGLRGLATDEDLPFSFKTGEEVRESMEELIAAEFP